MSERSLHLRPPRTPRPPTHHPPPAALQLPLPLPGPPLPQPAPHCDHSPFELAPRCHHAPLQLAPLLRLPPPPTWHPAAECQSQNPHPRPKNPQSLHPVANNLNPFPPRRSPPLQPHPPQTPRLHPLPRPIRRTPHHRPPHPRPPRPGGLAMTPRPTPNSSPAIFLVRHAPRRGTLDSVAKHVVIQRLLALRVVSATGRKSRDAMGIAASRISSRSSSAFRSPSSPPAAN